MFFDEVANRWYENKVKVFNKYKTIITYKGVIDKYINTYFKGEKVEEITNEKIQKFIRYLVHEQLSNNYINLIFVIFKQILKYYNRDFGKTNIYLSDLSLPKRETNNVQAFTYDEQKVIQKEVIKSKKSYLFGIIIVLYTGLRIGELLALKWSNVYLKEGYILVDSTVSDGYDQSGIFTRIYSSPKSNSSRRIIYMPLKLIQYLKDIKASSESEFVISNGSKPKFVRCYQHTYKRFLNKIGIKYKNFHALRHTFATRAIENGVDFKTLSVIMGHKSASITMNIYVDSTNYLKKKMISKLNKLLEF